MSGLEREIFDENLGMVTKQNEFNQNPNTATWLRNYYIRQNGTRKKVEGFSQVSDDFDDKPVQNIVSYVSINGKVEWLAQVENRWYRIDDDGTTTEIASLSDTKKHRHCNFKGKLIVGSRDQTPHKYFYLRPADSITSSSITGNSNSGKPNRTYYIRVTYNSVNGETEADINESQLVNNDEWLKVSSPPDQDGADSWNIYVSETEGEENLQKQNIPIGTDFNEEDDGISDSGSADYPTKNTAWRFKPLGGDAPKADYWATHNKRLFAGGIENDAMKLRYCKLEDEDTWAPAANANDPGTLEFDLLLSDGDFLSGIGSIQDRLVVFFEDHIITIVFPEDQTKFSIEQIMQGKGCVSHDSIIGVGGELFWLSKYGFQAISQEFGVENLLFDDENPSSSIDDELAHQVEEIIDEGDEQFIESVYYPLRNWILLQVPKSTGNGDVSEGRWWFFDLDDPGGWGIIDGFDARSLDVNREEKVYSGLHGEVVEVFDGTYDRKGNSYPAEWSTPWLYLGDPNLVKRFSYIVFPVESDRETEFTLSAVTDGGQDKIEHQNIDLELNDQSTFNVARWGSGLYSDTVKQVKKVPLQVSGRSIKLIWEHNDKADFRIPFYELLYTMGGDR